MSRLQADLWLVLIAIIWGTTFVTVKNSLDAVGPFLFVASRFWVAALLLLVPLLLRRPALTPGLLRDGGLTGLALAGGFLFQTIGLQSTAAGKAAFLTGLNVVIVPLLAALLLRQPPARHARAGVLLALVGLGLMTLDRSLMLERGDVWVMGCALVFALHIIAVARYASRHEVLPFTLVQLATVGGIASGAALLFEREALLPPPAALPAILYMGVIATALVFGLQSWVQRYTTPTHTALIFSLEPLFAALFAILFAAESLEQKEWIGGAMILAGMLLAEVGDLLWKKRRIAAPRPIEEELPDWQQAM